MRIALGQLWQETNTFNPQPTTRADFEALGVLRGADLLERMAQTNELGGFISSLRDWQPAPELVGLVRLPAWPSGTCTGPTLDWLCEEFDTALERAGRVDAVLLALHGAMVAQSCPDVEGHLLDLVRRRVGPRVPIVATLDLHTFLTPQMAQAADALVLYHSMPHVDVQATGRRAAEVLRKMLYQGACPVTAWCRVPCVVPAEGANTESGQGPGVHLKAHVKQVEATPGVLSAGLATVQPWLEVPELSSAALVVADGDAALAERLCAELATDLWQRRKDFLPQLTELPDAVRQAHAQREGLVVFSDGSDATTSGAPGDSVWILEEVLRYQWPRCVLLALVDGDVVAAARRVGAGGQLRARLGGKRDTRYGKSIEVQAEVEKLFDADFVLSGHIGTKMPISLGPSAVLRMGNVRVVVTSRSGPHFAPELFAAAGHDPFAAQLVVAKSPCGFRAAYERHAAQIFTVRTGGCAPSDFWNYPYSQRLRPLWPFEPMEDFSPEPIVFRSAGGAAASH